jgi:hypothetical protein
MIKRRKAIICAALIVMALSISALSAAQVPSPLSEVAADVAKVDRYPAITIWLDENMWCVSCDPPA